MPTIVLARRQGKRSQLASLKVNIGRGLRTLQTIDFDLLTAHSKLAGAPPQAAKIVFIPCEVYPGDQQDATPIVRVVGLIKAGRDSATRARLLAGLSAAIQTHAKQLGVEITLIENRPEVGDVLYIPECLFSWLTTFHCSGCRPLRRTGHVGASKEMGRSCP